MVRLKGAVANAEYIGRVMFQFHNGSIKSIFPTQK